mgnify:CR=1 FL=1
MTSNQSSGESLLSETITVDGHADTLGRFLEAPGRFYEGDPAGRMDAPRMDAIFQSVQTMAIFTPPDRRGEEAKRYAWDFVAGIDGVLGRAENVARSSPFYRIDSRGDLPTTPDRAGGILVSIEGVSPLVGDVSELDRLFEAGVRSIILTHNHDNEAAKGCFSTRGDRGLTSFGVEVVRRAEELGMVIDLAHANPDVFADVLEAAHGPVVDSHTGFCRFFDLPRNLSDDQARRIAETGGVVCVFFVPELLRKGARRDGDVTIEELATVFEHAVDVCGIDHIGIGSDWDGFVGSVKGLDEASKLPALVEALLGRGFRRDDLKKILGENLLRVLRTALPA